MTRKNKLYKHHKSKSFFYIKDFSFGILAILGIGTAIAVPTYIASHQNEEVSLKAESKIENQQEDETTNNSEIDNLELLEY